MPQPRQRIVFCDCLDCVQQPSTTDIAACTSPANEAAARQEPPPKCLMFVLSGILLPQADPKAPGSATVLDTCSLPHLNRATAQGNLCLLTLRQEGDADSCTELAQLFDAYQERQQGQPPITLAHRFKGLMASFSSNSAAAEDVAASVGMAPSSVLQPLGAGTQLDDDGGLSGGSLNPHLTAVGRGRHTPAIGAAAAAAAAGGNEAEAATGGSSGTDAAAAGVSQQLPDPAEAARRVLEELGLQQADAGLDLLVVHLDLDSLLQQQQQQDMQTLGHHQQQQQQSNTAQAGAGTGTAVAGAAAQQLLGWLDRTLRYLNNSSAFKDTVLLTVLATPCRYQQPADLPMLAAAGGTQLDKFVPQQGHMQLQQQDGTGNRRVLKPMQSWQQFEGKPLAVCQQRAILCMRRLAGVIRRDDCSRFSLSDCCSSSGTLALLADRLLPEIAYKLGRAPKYGA